MVKTPTCRILRRLTAAEGYLELGLPGLALDELGAIQGTGEYQVPVMWMTGQALKAQGRFEEAIEPLQFVTQSLVGPAREQASQSLTECLKKSGRTVSGSGPLSDSQPAHANPPPADHRRRVNIRIPGLGLLKFAAADGSVTIHFEPLRSEHPESDLPE